MMKENNFSMAELAWAHGIKSVLYSVLTVFDYPRKPFLQPLEKILTLNASIKKYAKQINLIYLDYFSSLVDEGKGMKAEYLGDGVHPNAAGYKLMAPLAGSGIKKALSQ